MGNIQGWLCIIKINIEVILFFYSIAYDINLKSGFRRESGEYIKFFDKKLYKK